MTPLNFLTWCGAICVGLLVVAFGILVVGACVSAVKNIKVK